MVLLWGILVCHVNSCHLHIYCTADVSFNAWAISLKHDGKIKWIDYLPERGGVTGCAGGCPWKSNTAIMCWNMEPLWSGELLDIEFEYPPSTVVFSIDTPERPTGIGDCLPRQGFEGGGPFMLDEPQAQSLFYIEAVGTSYGIIGWAQELPVIVLGIQYLEEEPSTSRGIKQ